MQTLQPWIREIQRGVQWYTPIYSFISSSFSVSISESPCRHWNNCWTVDTAAWRNTDPNIENMLQNSIWDEVQRRAGWTLDYPLYKSFMNSCILRHSVTWGGICRNVEKISSPLRPFSKLWHSTCTVCTNQCRAESSFVNLRPKASYPPSSLLSSSYVCLFCCSFVLSRFFVEALLVQNSTLVCPPQFNCVFLNFYSLVGWIRIENNADPQHWFIRWSIIR